MRRLAPLLLLAALPLLAQTAPRIAKIDPPDWFASLPAPLLLIRGENLSGARFTLSDPALHVQSENVSANGHWATVQLVASPAEPETIEITATTSSGSTRAPFRFTPKRTALPQGFDPKDTIYLLMTDRFADGDPLNDGPNHAAELAKPRGWHGGDLRGVEQHLDYLQSLGITTVWTTPVYQNHGPEAYHGYHATDLYAVDEHFGALSDLQSLSAAAHKRGMKLLLDTVPNHVGAAHPWVEDEPEPDWFHGTEENHREAVGEFASLIDPHAPWRDQRDITEGWFVDQLPDLNQENPDVRRYLIQNAIWWLEQSGADGLRIDTFPYVGRPFWHEFHAELHALYPNLTSVGEVFNLKPAIVSSFAGGVARNDRDGHIDTGLYTPFDFPSFVALDQVLLQEKSFSTYADILREDSLYPHPERLVTLLDNHDTPRFLSEKGGSAAKLKLAFAIQLMSRGIPQVYAGDEIGMEGGKDPDNRRDFPGGFGGVAKPVSQIADANHKPPASTPASAFTEAGRAPAQQELFTYVRNLLHRRAEYPELNSGDEQILYADGDTLVFARGAALDRGCTPGRGRVVLAVNKGDKPETIAFDTENTALVGCNPSQALLGSAPTQDKTKQQLTVAPGASLQYWK